MSRRYKQNPGIETAPLGRGLVLLEPNGRKFCALNATSGIIWAQMCEPVTIDQLVLHLIDIFQGVSADDARRDVLSVIGEMESLGFVSQEA